MKTVYFVVSLPRTGTKSICKMANILGFDFKHTFVGTIDRDIQRGVKFFSDTPSYVPSFIEQMCKKTDIIPKFIYIDKKPEDIFSSWNKVTLYRNYLNMYSQYFDEEQREKMSIHSINDFLSYHESFSEIILKEENCQELIIQHKNKVIEIIEKYKRELLIYNFEEGWKPFCGFLDCEVPNIEIPHLNTDTMFEKII